MSSTIGLLTLAALPAAEAKTRRQEFTTGGRWPVMQGATDRDSATLLISHPNNIPLQYSVLDHNGREAYSIIDDFFPVSGATMAITQVSVHGLKPGQDYILNLFGLDGRVFDQRVFRALDTKRRDVRFAVVSCMNDDLAEKGRSVWEALANEQPEFVFFLGDTVYADKENSGGDDAGFGRRYAHARSAIAWFYMPRLIPSFATWDDHDYGANNGDKSFSMASTTGKLFRQFWGNRFTKTYEKGHGVGSILRAFGQRFFLMDDRSFRDASGTSRASHWGQEQKEWLLAEIASSDSPCWLMNGNQFFINSYPGAEGFQKNFAEDFRDFLRQLRRLDAPVCFVSGDVHFSEISRIEPELLGYETFEYTSSSMHSHSFPGHQRLARNSRRVASEWRYNFLMFESSLGSKGWQIDSRCVLARNATSFAHRTAIQR